MKRGGKKRNRNRKKMGRSARASGVLPLLNQFFLFKAVCAPKPEQGAERTAYGAEFQGQKETRRGSQNMHIQITLLLWPIAANLFWSLHLIHSNVWQPTNAKMSRFLVSYLVTTELFTTEYSYNLQAVPH